MSFAGSASLRICLLAAVLRLAGLRSERHRHHRGGYQGCLRRRDSERHCHRDQHRDQCHLHRHSDSQGAFSILLLPVGVYNLTASVAGFKKYDALGIRVQVNETSRVDLTLQVGATTESVDVEAVAVHVDTESPVLKTVIDQTRVEDLPLNGRDPVQLTRLVAGVGLYNGAGVTSGTSYPGSGGAGVAAVSINGGRGNTTNYILDGGQNNDHYNNAPNPMPNPDALQEFSVQTNNFSAEYGRNVGGVVNAVTKSGTNALHGAAFGYLRNAALERRELLRACESRQSQHQAERRIEAQPVWRHAGRPGRLPEAVQRQEQDVLLLLLSGHANPAAAVLRLHYGHERRRA